MGRGKVCNDVEELTRILKDGIKKATWLKPLSTRTPAVSYGPQKAMWRELYKLSDKFSFSRDAIATSLQKTVDDNENLRASFREGELPDWLKESLKRFQKHCQHLAKTNRLHPEAKWMRKLLGDDEEAAATEQTPSAQKATVAKKKPVAQAAAQEKGKGKDQGDEEKEEEEDEKDAEKEEEEEEDEEEEEEE